MPPSNADLDPLAYQQIEEFRFRLRSFLHFSETAARAAGLEPQQHQALLVIKAAAAETPPTVGHIAARLLLKHHSAVGLVNRLQALGLVARIANPADARQVLVRLTPRGERILRDLSLAHRTELEQTAPALIAILRSVTGKTTKKVSVP